MEIDKVLKGSSGEYAHSVDAGMLSHFLTWMQESKGEKIIVCTCNDISGIPPEFMGRFNVSFFVDYPNMKERKEIVNIMNKRYESSLPTDDDFISTLNEWTGREIEMLARDSLFDDIETAKRNVPLLKNMKAKEMESIRKQYKNQMRCASKEITEETKTVKRKMNSDKEVVDDKMKRSLKEILAKKKKN